ncbi:hypothetical protein CR513_57543, partial [Mucuna pruriens]
MVTMFIDTIPSLYYDKIVGNVASNFADLVVVDERIELGIRRGKFAQTNSSANIAMKPVPEKKKGEANAVLVEPVFRQTKANVSRTQHGSRWDLGQQLYHYHSSLYIQGVTTLTSDVTIMGTLLKDARVSNTKSKTCWTRVGSDSRTKLLTYRATLSQLTKAGRAVKLACQRVEEFHPGQSSMAVTDLIAYIEGNDNPCPKSFIVHYNNLSD